MFSCKRKQAAFERYVRILLAPGATDHVCIVLFGQENDRALVLVRERYRDRASQNIWRVMGMLSKHAGVLHVESYVLSDELYYATHSVAALCGGDFGIAYLDALHPSSVMSSATVSEPSAAA